MSSLESPEQWIGACPLVSELRGYAGPDRSAYAVELLASLWCYSDAEMGDSVPSVNNLMLTAKTPLYTTEENWAPHFLAQKVMACTRLRYLGLCAANSCAKKEDVSSVLDEIATLGEDISVDDSWRMGPKLTELNDVEKSDEYLAKQKEGAIVVDYWVELD